MTPGFKERETQKSRDGIAHTLNHRSENIRRDCFAPFLHNPTRKLLTGSAPAAILSRMPGSVGYFRVSTAEQANTNYSLPAQEAKFNNFCTNNGLTVVKIFIDRHSARTDARPEFQKMLAS